VLGLGAVEVRIGHEASAARKRRQAKGADAGHSDGALGLCVRAWVCQAELAPPRSSDLAPVAK
jgi:hypothetical protein